MSIVSQIVRLIYRIRYWLIFLPVLATLVAIYQTRNMYRVYAVSTTIYTGVASGFTIESGSEGGRVDWNSVSNEVDNIISIIRSKTTLRNVSLRLYTQHMIYGDSLQDNQYIKANNYRHLLRITPKEVQRLIDKTSEEKTIENLNAYEKATPQNFVYGLFNWFHPHYSYAALSNIDVRRIFNSDMLLIQYAADDPGIAYNTLMLLNDEFVRQYEHLRFGQTNNVVEYFRQELLKLGNRLREYEDSLTHYYIEKKIINYPEQTKIIAALSRDYDLTYNDLLIRYTSSRQIVTEMEDKIEMQATMLRNNTEFMDKLSNLSQLSTQLARVKAFADDTTSQLGVAVSFYNERIREAEDDVKAFSSRIFETQYTKEGVATSTYLDVWVTELINRERTFAQMQVVEEIKEDLEKQYVYYSPIGSTLKRKEREITITEQSYLNLLASLNTALMRQKNLEMTSATLQAIDPPFFPIYPVQTARRMIVMATFFGTIVLVLGFFILLEILDKTVRDKERAERLIPSTVLGAFPKKNIIKYRRYNKEYKRIATNYLATTIVPYLNPKERPDIINFISTDDNVGKSTLIKLLEEYWSERGLRVKVISWHEDLSVDSRGFILSTNLGDIYDYENEDIIIVEHKSIVKSAIPVGLLREASVNIVVVRADKVWRDIDKLAFDRLQSQTNGSPLVLYLTQVNRIVAENFMGLLPPYSQVRKFVYKVIQLGFTSK